jgi:comEA protein
MNRKERLASFVVLATLFIGIISGLIDRDDMENCVLQEGDECLPQGQTENDSYLRLDLNRASAGELMALPGIGEVRALAIVTWRDENGPFSSVDDLERVRGIGPATVERLRPYVTAGGAAGAGRSGP